jgi:hypothetical protein
MSQYLLSKPTGKLALQIKGIWWLISREDWTGAGQQRIDPVLGPDPIAILAYGPSHFAAQFMKRDRSAENTIQSSFSSVNNTQAIGGYDAYFGIYAVNEETGQVKHTLLGSLTIANVGLSVMRDLRVEGDKLVIQLKTSTLESESITRTLIWQRIG